MTTKTESEKKIVKRIRRHKRIRAKVVGTAQRPRLSVFRSSQHIYVQLIDDSKNKTLASASDKDLTLKKTKVEIKKEDGKEQLKGKQALAWEVGKIIALKAKEMKIDTVVFDRGGNIYHGRIKCLADGARKGGLKF